MKFVDEIQIEVRGGHGGAGSVHFLREKYRPNGGPDGGDGGRGGDVFLVANPGMQALGHLMHAKKYRAEDGEAGRRTRQSGAAGEHFTLQMPVGTQVYDADTNELLGDLSRPNSRLSVAQGGKGGFGNQHFATSTNQTPERAGPGLPGQKRTLLLRLKLLADAGLIGLPNAGKSTLLSGLSHKHPKIADYAFTTLTPNIGVLENQDYRRLLLADIPGIIAGASAGAGLGLSFLRHIERVRVMVYVLDVSSLELRATLLILQQELESYSPELLRRPAILVLNKMDQANYDLDYARELSRELCDPDLWRDTTPPPLLFISALEEQGLDEFKRVLFELFPDPTFAEQTLPEFPG